MNLINLDIRMLRSLTSVVETGSITETARRLGRTQPAITLQLQRLEELTGKAIFTHEGRKLFLTADGETPIGVYRKLAGGPGSFLLESAEQGAATGGIAWSRYSFIGVRSAATLTSDDGEARWLGTPPAGVPTSGDAVAALRETIAALSSVDQPETGEPRCGIALSAGHRQAGRQHDIAH